MIWSPERRALPRCRRDLRHSLRNLPPQTRCAQPELKPPVPAQAQLPLEPRKTLWARHRPPKHESARRCRPRQPEAAMPNSRLLNRSRARRSGTRLPTFPGPTARAREPGSRRHARILRHGSPQPAAPHDRPATRMDWHSLEHEIVGSS